MKKVHINKCRFCENTLTHTFVDLGMSPVANDYMDEYQTSHMEPFFPLHVYVCSNCFLVQLPNHRTEDEIFTDHYSYFSSYSSSWLEHSKKYVEMMCKRNRYDSSHLVVELASNDGYLLQYFKDKNIPVLGVEPTKNTASVAIKKGIPTITKFFGIDTAKELAKTGKKADLLIGNNVLAHVPDLNDFVAGMKIVLKPSGIITMEFPHLLRLMQKNQFDTIYHEHFSYFSLKTVERIFAYHGLTIFDVDELTTHGGSIRIYARHTKNKALKKTKNVRLVKQKENAYGLGRLQTYAKFHKKVAKIKVDFLEFLIQAKKEKKTVAGYGAPAKGNTFLNFCGTRTDFIQYTVDASPHKQHHYLPGVKIPIFSPQKINETKPDYVLILPWNLKKEIMSNMTDIRHWGGKFVTAIPKLEVH